MLSSYSYLNRIDAIFYSKASIEQANLMYLSAKVQFSFVFISRSLYYDFSLGVGRMF